MELHVLMKLLAYAAEENMEQAHEDDVPYGEKVMMVRIDNSFYDLSMDIVVTENCVVLEVESVENQDGQYTH